ncbi:MAG: DUF1292 domain-containing protein [Thermoflexaceae bacterium]|nr:DUF1292 domain-containing protein [Thermoflexaceae bacterium]
MGKNSENEPLIPDDFDTTVTLTLDNDEELECAVISIFDANGRRYIALLPLEGKAADDGEVYLYRYNETEDGQPDLANIESDEEFEIVSDAFDEMLDEAEYQELLGDDEE